MPLSELPKKINWFVQVYSKQVKLELWMETDPERLPADDPDSQPNAEEAAAIEAQRQRELKLQQEKEQAEF